jgi:PPOX class probable F420-dependent enzyme
MSAIPEAFSDLLTTKKAFASLATINTDGAAQVTPVWFDWAGSRIRMNTAKGRVKDQNLRRTPAVALSIMDPDDPYRDVQVKGRVAAVTESGADAHADVLSKKYLGQDRYPDRKPGESRVMFTIAPDRVQTMG